ncbi:hypothetical protein [Alkalibacterium sp. MB6]|uniref:hypothetical protein n=1 Tax=Alkalibacterium sp. MB6 TaxID=2081965 RepID=UPI00137A0126|nr:hypothetical protein [Alkalibacterium sp. MB6]
MIDKNRNYILNPWYTSGKVDGQYLTFSIDPFSYEEETDFIMLIERKSKDLYEAKYINNKFYNISKMRYKSQI